MINRVAPAFLVPVLFSLLCIFVGIFSARHDHPAGLCCLCLILILSCITLFLSFLERFLKTLCVILVCYALSLHTPSVSFVTFFQFLICS